MSSAIGRPNRNAAAPGARSWRRIPAATFGQRLPALTFAQCPPESAPAESVGSLPSAKAASFTGSHPLADAAVSDGLRRRADEIEAAFGAIEPALRALAARQLEPGFAAWADAELRSRLGFAPPPQLLAATWSAPLDVRQLYGHAVVQTFRGLVARAFDRRLAEFTDGESASAAIERWGFHAVDITPCADGRLSGVVDYILRVPPAVIVARRSYAGALFDVEETLGQWAAVELGRWREGKPNAADAPTRYLKIGVYHFSSVDPGHGGCAAHGSDATRAATALLDRLERFVLAVERSYGCGAAAAALLVGVDTDTDAIRVHVPDARGAMDPVRYVDNAILFERTRGLEREAAKTAIRDAVAACADVAADDAPTQGMRWFCGYLLKNNIGQVDAVRSRYGSAYADRGHTERLIVVGDGVDDVQLRNIAFQAQMTTVEAGAGDLDIGVRILSERHAVAGLAVPVLVHFRYDPRIPGADDVARARALRLRAAILARYAQQAARGMLYVSAVIRAGDGSVLTAADPCDRAATECYG
jgi:carboxysome shell carbonic anhydrase